MTTRPSTLRRSILGGLLAPLMAFGASFVAALFLTTSSTSGGITVTVWGLATVLPMLGLVLTRRFRDRPASGAGLFGVVAGIAGLATLAALNAESDALFFVCLGAVLVVAGGAGVVAERVEIMRETALPSSAVRGLTLLAMVGAVGAAVAIACPSTNTAVEHELGERIGSVEIPALPTVVRERLPWPDHRYGVEVEVTSTAMPGGGASAEIVLVRETMEGVTRSTPCLLDVGSNGRTVDVYASDEAFEVRWPISPHGESFGGCTYAQSTLGPMDGAIRTETFGVSWTLVIAPLYGLFALGVAWSLRRRHARLDRSPEVRVTEPGIAVMPDGAPATVSAEIPMGTTIVALRLADVRPDYRSDARLAIEEHAIGEKAALLVDLARRVRTLELTGLGGVTLLGSIVLVSWLAGAVLGY